MPQPWLQRSAILPNMPEIDLVEPETLVYALVCAHRGNVYVGETGGSLHGKRPLLNRYLEHIKAGTYCSRKGVGQAQQDHLYHHMLHEGAWNWIIVPLQFTTPPKRLLDGSSWCSKFPQVHNILPHWKAKGRWKEFSRIKSPAATSLEYHF